MFTAVFLHAHNTAYCAVIEANHSPHQQKRAGIQAARQHMRILADGCELAVARDNALVNSALAANHDAVKRYTLSRTNKNKLTNSDFCRTDHALFAFHIDDSRFFRYAACLLRHFAVRAGENKITCNLSDTVKNQHNRGLRTVMQQKRAERYHKHERVFTEKPPVRQLLYCVSGNGNRCQQIRQKIKDKGDMIIAPEQRSGNHKCCRCNQPNQCELHIHHGHRLISAFAAARRSSFGIFPPQTGLLPSSHFGSILRSFHERHAFRLALALMQHRKGSRQRLHIFGLRCRFFFRIILKPFLFLVLSGLFLYFPEMFELINRLINAAFFLIRRLCSGR